MRFIIKSTELSRITPKVSGRVPSMASAAKLRERARAGLGEFQSEQLTVQRLFRTKPETTEPDRHVIFIDDVTRGLGLQQVDEQKIQKAIQDTNAEFTPKGQTQRIFHAQGKLSELLRSMKSVPSDARLEIAKRARAWWKKSSDTDLNRNRSVHFIRWGKSDALCKAGPFIGPKGGKWADAKHTIPWKESKTKLVIPAGVPKSIASRARTLINKVEKAVSKFNWGEIDRIELSKIANQAQDYVQNKVAPYAGSYRAVEPLQDKIEELKRQASEEKRTEVRRMRLEVKSKGAVAPPKRPVDPALASFERELRLMRNK